MGKWKWCIEVVDTAKSRTDTVLLYRYFFASESLKDAKAQGMLELQKVFWKFGFTNEGLSSWRHKNVFRRFKHPRLLYRKDKNVPYKRINLESLNRDVKEA